MKNIGKYFIVAYMIIVTAVAAIFGTLYFTSKKGNDESFNLSYQQAQELVKEVDAKTKQSFFGETSASSLNETDYNKNQFAEIITNPTVSNLLTGVKNMLNSAKNFFSENAEQNVWYTTTDKQYFSKYSINKNTVCIYNAEKVDNQDRYDWITSFVVTKTGDKTWAVDFYLVGFTTVEFNNDTHDGYFYPQSLSYKFDGNQIYYIETTISPLAYQEVKTSVSNASEIIIMGYYKCDLNAHKEIDRFTTEENRNKIADGEKVSLTNQMLAGVSKYCKVYTISDFGDYKTL